ncbi:NAD(P)-dependent oxidoreductase [Phaeobacter sp. HF9A]|uniref:NAD-dependent epimerase/dehydratase family protein n=1 Tax=Phaeobacter sp. HF9A TaxID=2721561 RepID=UPI00142FF023|nr:NAD(P)-dependent oxidoreductase [Phaeobacter sp. HF9A]NIZ15474.1 NAD(P)-dependent oxidoreductase [Phaeobacter sp. HF9A]
MVKRIYITGSGGILGRHVLAAIAQFAPDAEVIRNTADLTNLSTISQDIDAAGPLDLVIHLAALVAVADVTKDPARGFAVNAAGTINLLAALGSSPARLLQCSTGHVYAPQDTPIAESQTTEPLSLYGKSKLLGEQAAREICAETGRSICVARLFSIHDPQQQGSYLRPTLERRFASHDPEQPFELHGADGLRDFLTAKDAARLLVRLALTDAEGVVNVGSGQPITVADFAREIAPFPVKIKSIGTSNNVFPDISLLKKYLGASNV